MFSHVREIACSFFLFLFLFNRVEMFIQLWSQYNIFTWLYRGRIDEFQTINFLFLGKWVRFYAKISFCLGTQNGRSVSKTHCINISRRVVFQSKFNQFKPLIRVNDLFVLMTRKVSSCSESVSLFYCEDFLSFTREFEKSL